MSGQGCVLYPKSKIKCKPGCLAFKYKNKCIALNKDTSNCYWSRKYALIIGICEGILQVGGGGVGRGRWGRVDSS